MKRNHEIRVKLSKSEKEKILDRARESGLSASSYLRLLGLTIHVGFEK